MSPLDLVDDVVNDWWKDEIYEELRDSPYSSFCTKGVNGGQLLSPKEVLDYRKHVFDYPEMAIEDFFNFDDAFKNIWIGPYRESDLYEDLDFKEPVYSAIKSLENTPKNKNWQKITCDLSFFGCDTLEKSNAYEDFDLEFNEFCMDIASELTLIDKPLVEYTDCPYKKIWSKITVDGIPLLTWLNVSH